MCRNCQFLTDFSQRLTAFLMDKVDSELKYEVSYYAAVYVRK
jgi:hypothetical protein